MVASKEAYTDWYDAEVEPQQRDNIPTGKKGTHYHLVVDQVEVGEWDDGRPRLDCRTKVASGEFEGQFGPRLTFSIGGFESKNYSVSAAEQARTLAQFVRTVHPEPVQLESNPHFEDGEPVGFDGALLEELVDVLEGGEFITLVKEDKNGYLRAYKTPDRKKEGVIGRTYYAVESPPDGFQFDGDLAGFSLNGAKA